MDTIKIEITYDVLQQAIMDNIQSILKRDYGNPLRDVIEKCINDKKGLIQETVNEVISESLTKTEFKEKLGEIVLQTMVNAALKK